ncbi:MAG TPA: type II toxin-antitoxin system RelE/ParE family toxin [Balneolaceae bacterium]|nr:type II toxin-antitoxin system RelE/ParE family toxin [Balneolaceae bacterium]
MDWQVQIERKAQKALKKIPNPYKANIIEAIDSLADKPRPHNCTKLKGASDLWRVRVNDYRIVYQIKDTKLLVLIVRIGHRRDVYEGL